MGRRKQSDTEAKYFSRMFNHILKEQGIGVKGKEKKKTFQKFLCEVGAAHYERTEEDRIPDYKLLRKWRGEDTEGKQTFPSDYFEDIVKVLGVSASVFFPPTFISEFDITVREQSDKIRLEYAERIGLDKFFMLFILNTFNGPEFSDIKDYGRLKEMLGDEPEFDDYTAMSLSPEIAETLLCKFRGLTMPEGVEVISNLYYLPCKKDLLYMKILQDKYSSFLRIEVKDLVKTIAANVKPKTQEEIDRQLIKQHKKGQKSNNIMRESEGEPKITLAEYFVLKEGGYTDFAKALKETSEWLKEHGEDPDQIN